MAFLRSPFAPDLPPVLRAGKVILRTPETDDFEAWVELRLEIVGLGRAQYDFPGA